MSESKSYDYSNPYVPSDILRALHGVESTFGTAKTKNGLMVSPAGATGHFQFIPETAKEYGLSREDTFNFDKSKLAAAKFLSKLHNEFGNWEEALRAYNAGAKGYKDIKSGIKKSPENEAYYGRFLSFMPKGGQTPLSSRGVLMAGAQAGKLSDPKSSNNVVAQEDKTKPTRSLQDIVSLTTQLEDITKPEREQAALKKQEISGIESDIAQRKDDLEKQRASGVVGIEQEAKTRRDAATAEFESAKEAQPIPAFVPTRDSAEDLAKLFSFIGVMGTLLGKGGGKQAAMGAMSAMTGMMEGWQKGRKDLYDQEKIKFEKDLAQINKIHDELYKKMKDAVDTASKDKRLGEAKLNEALAESGSDILKMTNKLRGPQAALETIKETIRSKTDLMKTAATLLDKDRSAEFRETQLKQSKDLAEARIALQQAGIDLRQQILDAKQPGTAEGKEKTTADIRNKFEGARDSLSAMTNVLEKIDNPVVKKEWEKGWAEAKRFLSEKTSDDSMLSKFIRSKALESLDPQVRDLVITIASARNDYYKAISGTAVSGNEGTRNFGAVIQPTDSLESLRSKAKNIAERYSGKVSDYIDSYQFATGIVNSSQAQIKAARKYLSTTKSFATEQEAQAAFDRGELQDGDKVQIGGQSGTWRK